MKLHIDFPKITALFPNHPSVKLVPGSILTYTIPIGFREVVFTCNAVSWSPLASEWQSERRTGLYSYSTLTENSFFSSTRLQFRNGFTLFDTAKYTCTVREIVSGFSDALNVTLIPSSERFFPAFTPTCVSNTTTAYFQVQVLDTSCASWMEPFEIAENFLDTVIGGILSQCEGCIANASMVVINPNTCNSLVEGAAVFRGKVITRQTDTTEALFCALDQWRQYGPAVVIAGELKHVDQQCHFKLRSSSDIRECSQVRAPSKDIPIPAIAGSSAGLGGFLLLLTVVAIIIIQKRRCGDG